MASPRRAGGKKKTYQWVLTVFFLSFGMSMLMSWSSSAALARASVVIAGLTVLLLVTLGIVTDMIGVAVTSASQAPLISMASKKVPGARQALWLTKNADRVSSICNDVVGDICGVVSGAAGTTLALRVAEMMGSASSFYIGIVVAGLIAALTVGGKAAAKTIAIKSSHRIVLFAGRVLAFFRK